MEKHNTMKRFGKLACHFKFFILFCLVFVVDGGGGDSNKIFLMVVKEQEARAPLEDTLLKG